MLQVCLGCSIKLNLSTKTLALGMLAMLQIWMKCLTAQLLLIKTLVFGMSVRLPDMDRMFKGASSFNQDISSWDVSNVENKYLTFNKATSFKSKFNPFRSKTKSKTKRKTFESLSSDDKKIIPKVKKLLGLRDYAKIDAGIELLRSLNQANLYEVLLDECYIGEYGHLKGNKFFSGSSNPAKTYLDYAMLCLVAYAPKDAEIHKSLKRENITKLRLDSHGIVTAPLAVTPNVAR